MTIEIICTQFQDILELAVPEMVVHGVISIHCIAVFIAVYNEKLFRSTPHLQILISVITCFVILGTDLGISVHYYQNYGLTRTTSAFQTIVIVYFFLPVPQKRQAIVLGGIVSIAHLTVSALFYSGDGKHDDDEVFLLVSNLACCNYLKLIRPIIHRFLPKQSTIFVEMWLEFILDSYQRLQFDALSWIDVAI